MTSSRIERGVMIALILVTLASAVAVASTAPGLIRFWPFTAAEFAQLMAPLFVVSLFIERVLEVFLTSWRGVEAKSLETNAEVAKLHLSLDEVVTSSKSMHDFKSRTQRIAFLAGTALGVIVSALGIRALELFVDPAVFGSLSSGQQAAFRVADVLFTGAVLGGGSEGLHKLVQVFTNFMETTAALVKARAP